MNRKIKFRAWQIKEKKMLSNSDLVDMNICADTYLFSPNEFVPLQYSGLKDKNGKDIYEGDIVRLAGETGANLIEFIEGCFSIHFPSERKDPHHYCQTLGMAMAHSTEIIGNIYDNPAHP